MAFNLFTLLLIGSASIIALSYAFSSHTSHISLTPGVHGTGADHLVFTSAFPAKLDLTKPFVSGISVGRYNAKREYSPELARIYSRYLANDMTIGALCPNGLHSPNGGLSITEDDINQAIVFATEQIQLYENANQQYLSIDPRGLNFSAYIFGGLLQARFNEFITSYLTTK